MAKTSTSTAHELLARNYKTDRDGEQYGVRVALRSDGAVLMRTRWTMTDTGREMTRSSGYSLTRLRIKAEVLEGVANGTTNVIEMLDRVMTRRRFEVDVDAPKEKAPKPEGPTFDSLQEKIAWEKAEREKRYAGFAELHTKAVAAGRAAADAVTPEAMYVIERANPLDDTSPVIKREAPVMDGVCGFAWVSLSEGNSSFAHWARKHGGYQPSSYRGTYLNVSDYGQSMERKLAFARAYSEVLREAGIKAWPSSRMD